MYTMNELMRSYTTSVDKETKLLLKDPSPCENGNICIQITLVRLYTQDTSLNYHGGLRQSMPPIL